MLQPLQKKEWVVYDKAPFSGPSAVLEYLSRYTHRVAISNHRLLSVENNRVIFRWKDYREEDAKRQKTMTLEAGEFMRRFLQHVLPKGFHRIRQYGMLSNSKRKDALLRVRKLMAEDLLPDKEKMVSVEKSISNDSPFFCPRCLKPMRIISEFEPNHYSRVPPSIGGIAA